MFVNLFLCRPSSLNFNNEKRTGVIFDIQDIDNEELSFFLDDLFCDGIPENLDFSTKVPFAAIGEIEGPVEVGNLECVPQPDYMLFLDLESTPKGAVYSIEIDGTAIPGTFEKIANDIKSLEIEEL